MEGNKPGTDHGNTRRPVCIFLHSFTGGGAERVAVLLANSIVQRGGHVHVVVQNKEGPWRKTLDSRTTLFELGGRYRGLTFKLMRYLRSHHPVAVISFMSQFNVVALSAAALGSWRGRLIVTEHTSLQGSWVEMGFWKRWFFWGLMRILYRRAYRVVAVSRQLASDLIGQMDLPAETVVAIPNPVPVEEIREAAMESVSHRFFFEGVPLLIAVGSLTSVKDFPTLMRAVADLRKRRDIRLIVLGEGPVRSELEVLVKEIGLSEVVDLPGFVFPPWPWIARADMLVLSSRTEGWPSVLTEALALGIPVVATDCLTGPREILADGRFGRLVPVGDVAAMAAAIEATLDNPPDRSMLRGRAEEWSTGRVLDAYLFLITASVTA